jgi:hypothetical protein
MIVNNRGNILLLIDQVDHADLASQFASRWGSDSFREPAPFLEMVLAARFHDEGYRYSDDKPKLDPGEGRPFNYNQLPQDMGLQNHEESVNSVRTESLYTRILVSMHRTGLCRKRNGTADLKPGTENYIPPPKSASELPPPRQGFDKFVEREESWQEETRKTLSKSEEFSPLSTKEIVWTNYKLLQVWDRLSLYCCSLPSKDEEIFPVPTSYSEMKDVSIALNLVGENAIRVVPWPFNTDHFKVGVLAHMIQNSKYSSEPELMEAFYKGDREPLSYEFVKE